MLKAHTFPRQSVPKPNGDSSLTPSAAMKNAIPIQSSLCIRPPERGVAFPRRPRHVRAFARSLSAFASQRQ